MGSTGRDKPNRSYRRNRSARIDPNNSTASNNINYVQMALQCVPASESPKANQEPDFGVSQEQHLQYMLVKCLETYYNQAVAKLVDVGYTEEVAMRAILRTGQCNGRMDVSTNIFDNTLKFLQYSSGDDKVDNGIVYADLRQLVDHSLACMVALLLQFRPQLSKLDAFWCLLLSDLDIHRANVMDISSLPSRVDGNGSRSGSGSGVEIGWGSGSGSGIQNCSGSGSGSGNATVIGSGSGNAVVIGSGSGSGVEISSESGSGVEISSGSGSGVEISLRSGTAKPEGGVFGNEGPVEMTPLGSLYGGGGLRNGGTSEFALNGMNGFLSNEMTLQKEIECPERFNLSPLMMKLLKRNVAMYTAEFRAKLKHSQSQLQACPSSLSGVELSTTGSGERPERSVRQTGEPQYVKNQEVVNSIMTKFKDLNLDENSEPVSLDLKDELMRNLVSQIKDLEKQVQERKEWAQQKAIQAARKLCSDLTELKTLRMEHEEKQMLKKVKQTLDDSTIKKLSEMENALRKASGQVDRANAAVKKLETVNAEIRAEMECNKLNASESVMKCLEVANREKKLLKRLLQWEKLKAKMQEEIAAEQQKIADLQQELVGIEAATKEAEAKWRQEQKAKKQALSQVEEEYRLKESSEANNKRKLEALPLKIELDFQRHKDDLRRLEQEYERLKESAESTELEQSTGIRTEKSAENEDNDNRACMLCMQDEVSVVFLPCAHIVICTNCNDSYPKKGKATCPYCRAPIQQRVRIFGASS